MSKLPVKNAQGQSQGAYDLNDDLLVYDKGRQSMKDAVTAYRANGRAGTASTLHKSEVSGSRSKPWKQKGSGRARAGFRQSPVWRGGSVAFGPKPRSYRKKMTKKMARLAFRRAFSEKVAADQVLVVQDLGITEPRTKQFAAMMKQLELRTPILFVLDACTPDVALAARNLPGVELARVQDVNTYQLLRYPQVVVTEAAMPKLEERLNAKVRRGA